MTDQEYFAESKAGPPDCPAILPEPLVPSYAGWLCTRPKHHTGLHVACNHMRPCARWSTDYQPLPNFLLC